MENSDQNNSKRRVLPLILGILLMVSMGLNVYLFTRSHEAESLVDEREMEVDSLVDIKTSVENDYQSITFELDQFKGKNLQLDSLLEKANSDIEKQKKKIDKLLKENKDLPLIRRQMEELKAIRDQYRIQIEQLIKENKELKFENVNLTQEVDNLSKTTKQLNEKVEIASALRGESLTVKAYRDTSKGKFEETEKAKRVTRISAEFVIAENKVAKSGSRELVFRVLKPDGLVMSDPNAASGSFTRDDGRKVEYTQRRNVEYSNQRTDVKFECKAGEELSPGLYLAEVYLDGKMMGNYKLTLK